MSLVRRLSIRWRITLASLVVALLLSTVAVLAFRAATESILDSTTSTLLEHDAAPFVIEIANNPGQSIDRPGRGQLAAVVDPAGTTVQTTLPRSLLGKLHTIVGFDRTEHTVVGGDDSYRVLTIEVASPAGTWHVITARNLDSSTLLLSRITTALIVGAVIFVIGFGVASWLLTSAALRPVNRMRKQAEALVATGSTEPLPTGPAIDELSALATTLNEFLAQVRQSVDRERQLVSDASHELRTPLAVLMTQLELATLNTGDARALEEQVVAARGSAERLSALATGLLELSQLDARIPQGSSTWPELVAELADSVDRARLLAAARDVTIDFEAAGEPNSATYRISTTNFGRVLGNLMGNAISALPTGGALRVALRHSRAGIVLTVADNGPGMPEDFIPIAFDRFTRPDEARAAHKGGSGLGLAIVQAMVQAARGTVNLRNANGLVVTVSLPPAA
jgi:signal transduction histidine kinase